VHGSRRPLRADVNVPVDDKDIGTQPIVQELQRLRLAIEKLNVSIAGLTDQMEAERKKETYSVKEVADLVGRSAYTVRRWVREGTLEGIHPDGSNSSAILIPRRQVEALLATRGK